MEECPTLWEVVRAMVQPKEFSALEWKLLVVYSAGTLQGGVEWGENVKCGIEKDCVWSKPTVPAPFPHTPCSNTAIEKTFALFTKYLRNDCH